MKTLVSGAVLLILLVTRPAFANHDEGQGRSQDHLHGNDSVASFEVPEPSSGILLTLGAALFGGAAALRAFGRRKPTNSEAQQTDRT